MAGQKSLIRDVEAEGLARAKEGMPLSRDQRAALDRSAHARAAMRHTRTNKRRSMVSRLNKRVGIQR